MSGRVLVTGARGTLGRALVAAFYEKGWYVTAANRSVSTNDDQCDAVQEHLQLDLTEDAQIENTASRFFGLGTKGEHVALVANASNREALSEDWGELSRDSLHALFDVDVAGHFLLSRAFARHSIRNDCTATVLFVGSIYGSGGVHPSIYPEGMRPTPLQYSIVKAAVAGLAKDLAGRLGGSGITVNCLVPGGIESGQPGQFVRKFSALTQLGRMGRATEIAAVAEALCRPQSSYMTGQLIHVDGGWSAW